MKKTIILIFFLCIEFVVFSQTTITFTVKDADTKKPLPYCNVVIKGTAKGGITNANGVINLKINTENDIIEISFLGYETKLLKPNELNNTNTIFLKAKTYALKEVEIIANNDYLYDIVQKCRNKLLKQKNKNISKTYYSIETTTDSLPLEFLECYYNAKTTGIAINDITFKNGRTAIQRQDNYLINVNTSKAIIMLDLLNGNEFFPSLILNFNKLQMKKKFNVNLGMFNADYFIINFHPKKEIENYFSGQLWIDKVNFNLFKINLNIDTGQTHLNFTHIN